MGRIVLLWVQFKFFFIFEAGRSVLEEIESLKNICSRRQIIVIIFGTYLKDLFLQLELFVFIELLGFVQILQSKLVCCLSLKTYNV